MDDATIGNICETISTWGGASASGLSASANLVVEKLEAGLAAQTAAVNEYVGQIGTRFRDLATKAEQYANQVSSVGERSVYRSAAEYYGNEANKLLDTSIDASRRLSDFTEGTKLLLQNPLFSEVARTAGPLIDSISLGVSVLNDGIGTDATARVALISAH